MPTKRERRDHRLSDCPVCHSDNVRSYRRDIFTGLSGVECLDCPNETTSEGGVEDAIKEWNRQCEYSSDRSEGTVLTKEALLQLGFSQSVAGRLQKLRNLSEIETIEQLSAAAHSSNEDLTTYYMIGATCAEECTRLLDDPATS